MKGVVRLIEKQFRANIQTGTIHYLGACCSQATKIKNGNWQDYYSLVEAESELRNREKSFKLCKHCSWPKDKKED